MEIVEYTPEIPVTILCKGRYEYYLECERKSKLTDKEIHEIAIHMFKNWAENTTFTVELTNRSLHRAIRSCSFTTRWLEDVWYNNERLKDPTFTFEKFLNEAIVKIADNVYAEHFKQLKDEFVSKASERQKRYKNMCKITGISVILNIVLIISLISLIVLK